MNTFNTWANFGGASLLIGLLCLAPVSADIYKKVSPDGRVFLTDQPSGTGYRLVMRTPKKGTVAYKKFLINRKKLLPMIRAEASRFDVDPALVLAVVHAESFYDPNAISRVGATGLMQLMPGTAQKYGVSNRRDPSQNVQGGAQYLRDLLIMFDFDLRLALAAYNAGEHAVIKYGMTIPPYPETQNYVKKVIRYYQEYLDGRLN